MKAAELPLALPQFAHIRRAWDPGLARCLVKLLPGEYYVTRSDEMIFTVLGSCVSACVRDRKRGLGGMNHFMLPKDRSGAGQRGDIALGCAARYGDVAMQLLMRDVLNLGARREDLEVKLFGGGKVLDMSLDVGGLNVQFMRDYVHLNGLKIEAEDLGRDFARKLYYSPRSGEVRVKRLVPTVNRAVFEREQALARDQAA